MSLRPRAYRARTDELNPGHGTWNLNIVERGTGQKLKLNSCDLNIVERGTGQKTETELN